MIKEEMEFQIEEIAESRLPSIDFDQLIFGRTFSDHMFLMDYKDGGWGVPRIVPYQNLLLNPATSVLHYGQSIFEGMKAYRNEANEVFLFRPEENIKRFNISAERMCMPQVPEDIFHQALVRLMDMDRNWIPNNEGGSLYIRPFMYATDEYIGVKPSESYRMMIFTCPVNAYYSGALKVKVERHYTRAAHGGSGFAKCAGNYAASLYPARLAQQKGYHQLIWTDAVEHEWIEESGTMNIGFRKGNTILTPPVGDTILNGITRDSVLKLARSMGYDVEERPIAVTELKQWMKDGELDEAFGMGTAATIARIELIGFDDEDLQLSNSEDWEFANKVLAALNGIKTGRVEDQFNWNLKI